MKKILISLTLFFVLTITGCNVGRSLVSDEPNNYASIHSVTNLGANEKNLQKLANDFVSKYSSESPLSAISVTVQCRSMNNNNPITVFAGTFGHETEHKRAIKKDDLWSIGSNSKAFTAIVLIKLASDPKYKFNLDDHIQKWLSVNKYPDLQNLLRYNPTIRQIMNMTSGIANGNNHEAISYWFNHPYEYESPAFWVNFANPESNAMPGTQWNYTDTNYQILDILVQELTGDSLANQINNRILTPLNLKNTVYVINKPTDLVSRNRLVHTYYPIGESIVDLYDWSLSNNAGAGSILANTHDMNLFYRTLFATNKLLTHKEFLEMTSLVNTDNGQAILSPSDSKSGVAYGLGLLKYDLNNFVIKQGISLTQYPNLAKDIANYDNLYLYPGATTMGFIQIYNENNGASLIATYNSPSGPGLAPLVCILSKLRGKLSDFG